MLIGSAAHCQLVVTDAGVEAEHLELQRDLDGIVVRLQRDSGQGERRLRDGDEIQLGDCRLLFEEPAEESLQALTGEIDARLPSTPPAPPATPATEAMSEPAQAPTAAARHALRGASLDADVIIYALAAIVMAVSLAGLFVLLGE
jgi:hypothetical protein